MDQLINKILILFIIIFSACSVKKTAVKSNFTSGINLKIELNSKDIKGTAISIKSVDYKQTYYKDSIKKNKQILEINLPKEGLYNLDFNGVYTDNKYLSGWMNNIDLYVEQGKSYQIFAGNDQDILKKRSIVKTNSSLQNDLSDFNEKFYFLLDSLMSANKVKENELADTLFYDNKKEYNNEWAKYIKQKLYIQKEFAPIFTRDFALNHHSSIISAFKINEVWDLQEKYNVYQNIYDQLSEKVKLNEYGILFKRKLDALEHISYGKKIPVVAGKKPNDEEFTYDYTKNSFTLIEFWASWCKPCRDEHPELINIYNQFKNKGFDIISVSLDDKKTLWEHAITKDKLMWKNHYSDLQSFSKSENSIRFNLGFVPQNYLVDSKGNIIIKNIEFDDLKLYLDKNKTK